MSSWNLLVVDWDTAKEIILSQGRVIGQFGPAQPFIEVQARPSRPEKEVSGWVSSPSIGPFHSSNFLAGTANPVHRKEPLAWWTLVVLISSFAT